MTTQHTEQSEREELIRLADEYAEALAKFRMEDLYGTSKTYTANCKEEADEARQRLIATLLSTDAKPVVDGEQADVLIAGSKHEMNVAIGTQILRDAIYGKDKPAGGEAVYQANYIKNFWTDVDAQEFMRLQGSPTIQSRKLYTHPQPQPEAATPAREWVGLTQTEVTMTVSEVTLARKEDGTDPDFLTAFASAIESKLREKNAATPAAGEPVALPTRLADTAPKRIWLGLFTDEEDPAFPKDHEGICWAEDDFADVNVEYVRADLTHPHPQPEAGRVPLTDEDVRELLSEELGMVVLHAPVMRACFDAFRAAEKCYGIGKDQA